jgi:hypothetical protein
MVLELAVSGPWHVVLEIVVCILLVVAELLAVALIIAPRAVLRKLLSLLRAVAHRVVSGRRRQENPRRALSAPDHRDTT